MAQAGLPLTGGHLSANLALRRLWGAAMRDILILTLPVVVYFLLFPDQFHALLTWGMER